MSSGNKDIYILYGSQTGNSEDIAKDLEDKCRNAGIPVVCMTLNAAKKVTLKDMAKFLVVVCSTTGNGDSPENADAWWRTTKLRSAVSCHFIRKPV
jgi:sulfite reductase alpha subunit-like flavoprotein